ncbi:MAG: ribbon-helix-helix domain-containing protein [Pseudomonadota bacterium]
MMEKRSLSLQGHRTSIALEPPFWRVLEAAAAMRGLSVPKLVSEIDEARVVAPGSAGLASALRVFALDAVAKNPTLVTNPA